MKGLYQRVMKGVYPKIPAHYSSDLSAVLSSLLQVDPKKRPTCDQILHMPVFIQKHNELKLQEQGQSADDDPYNKTFDMLGTIKVPLNMKQLQINLPKSQYDADKEKIKVDKKKEYALDDK